MKLTVSAVAISVAALSLSACGALRDRHQEPEPTAPAPLPSATLSADAAWSPSATPCTGPGGHEDGCAVPGYGDRPFDVYVPSLYDPGGDALPVVVFLHGGGGNSIQTQATTCHGGDLNDPSCLHSLGDREGFLTVYPNGTSARLLPDLRTWNAGGGGDYACASGYACELGVDDVAYIGAVLDEVEAEFHVDASRVYVMGFSNGAAMTHRLGCEMSDRIAAIAPVSGSNSFATGSDCAPGRAVPVIYTHGTDDPCWTYETSNQACLDKQPLPKPGARFGVDAWVAADGCDPGALVGKMPNTAADRTLTVVETYVGCDDGAVVKHLRVEGGGHLFPGGNAKTLGGGFGGHSPQDWGVEVLWDFLSAYSL